MTTNGTQLAGAANQPFRQRQFGGSTSASTASIRHGSPTSRGAAGSIRCLPAIAAREGGGPRRQDQHGRAGGLNEDEIEPMMRWCAGEGFGLTLIETMPLGEVEEDRTAHYLAAGRGEAAAGAARSRWCRRWREPAGRRAISMWRSLGFGSASSRRSARISAAAATVYGLPRRARPTAALATTRRSSFRDLLRAGDVERAGEALDRLIAGKPERHGFDIAAAPASSGLPFERAIAVGAAGRLVAPSLRSGAPKLRHAPGMSALERVAGIEPARSAWEADRLPLHHTRSGRGWS